MEEHSIASKVFSGRGILTMIKITVKDVEHAKKPGQSDLNRKEHLKLWRFLEVIGFLRQQISLLSSRKQNKDSMRLLYISTVFPRDLTSFDRKACALTLQIRQWNQNLH